MIPNKKIARILSILICTLFHLVTASAQTGEEQLSRLRGNGMKFTENKGQVADMNGLVHPDILFKGEGEGMDIYLGKTGISYVLNNMKEMMHETEEQMEVLEQNRTIDKRKTKQELLNKQTLRLHRVDMRFEHSNPDPEVQASDKVEGYTNYYYGHCPQGITKVMSYNKIIQKNIYHNIDVKYYGGKTEGLKYDIIVNPGGNPDDIQLKYTGAEEIKIKNGIVEIKTGLGVIGEYLPKVYQNINGKTVDVKAEYKLTSLPLGEVLITFKLSRFNSNFPLVIDPWMTYFGGNGFDHGYSVATDLSGNVIVSGTTTSTNLPVSAGGYQQPYGGNTDAFIVKMNVNGSLLWASYYGGSNSDFGFDVKADAAGNILLAGNTKSGNLPVSATGANVVHQNAFGGCGGCFFEGDAFLVKFDPAGMLAWATYYGGPIEDAGMSVATNGSDIYLLGNTQSSSAISTPASFQPAYSGGGPGVEDMFVAKFTANGTLLWGTYVGGTSYEYSMNIACDINGDVYIEGITASTNFPVSPGCHQPVKGGSLGGGGYDACLFKFTPAGTRLWATFYGGKYGVDAACGGLATDKLGNVIIAGATQSGDAISTPSSYQPAFAGTPGTGWLNGFIAKFNSGGARQWGTYIGGGTNMGTYVFDITADVKNNIFVLGEFEDSDAGSYPISTCAFQPTYGGNEDQFVAKYDAAGKQHCISYLGGPSTDELDDAGGGITTNGSFLYVTGSTMGGGYPVTAGAFQTVTDNTWDTYIDQLCIDICQPKFSGFAANNSTVCPNTPVKFNPVISAACDTANDIFQWTFTGGNPASSDSVNPTVVFSGIGTHDVKLVVISACKTDSIINKAYITVIPCGTLTTTVAATTINCNGACTGTATATPVGTSPYTYLWTGGQTTNTATALCAGGYTVTVTDAASNTATASVTITQPTTALAVSASSVSATCGNNNGSATATVTGGTSSYTYAWDNAQTGVSATGLASGIYTVTVTDSKSCSQTATVQVDNSNGPTTTLSASANVSCKGSSDGTATLNAPSGGTTPYTYSWSGITQTTISISGLPKGTYTATVKDINNCQTTVSVTISEPTGITTIAPAVSDAHCGSADGSLIFSTPAGGTSPYTYSWNTNQTTQNITGIGAGDYTLTVSDSKNCTATITAHVNNFTPTVNLLSHTDASCNSASDGSATLDIPQGGTTPYSYSWNNGVTQTTISVSGLAANAYTVTVKDANNCITTVSIIITEPSPILTSAPSVSNAHCGAGDGSVNVTTPTGGASPYTYSWDNNQTTQNLNAVIAGTYILTIKDSKNCTTTISVIVNSIGGATVTLQSQTPAKCNGSADGTAVLNTPAGGTAPYTYSWSNGFTSTALTVSGLSAKDYTVTIKDANNCQSTISITITQPAAVSGSTTSTTVSCAGKTDGTAKASGSGGTAVYTYTWSNNKTGAAISGLANGDYTVTVVDQNNCSATKTISVGLPVPITPATTSTNAACNGIDNGTATASALGGTLPYSYSWSNNQTASSASTLAAGTYTVTITDQNNCSATKTIAVGITGGPTATAAGDTTITQGTAVQLNAKGGTSYLWTPPGNLSCTACPNPVATPKTSTWYIVNVTDNNGCSDKDSVYIEVEPPCGEIFIPTAFSPNDDGVNDKFCIRGKCINNYLLQIFDRWGELVFESTDIANCWSGTFNGKLLNTAVFVYQVRGINSKTSEAIDRKGNVTLLR